MFLLKSTFFIGIHFLLETFLSYLLKKSRRLCEIIFHNIVCTFLSPPPAGPVSSIKFGQVSRSNNFRINSSKSKCLFCIDNLIYNT